MGLSRRSFQDLLVPYREKQPWASLCIRKGGWLGLAYRVVVMDGNV